MPLASALRQWRWQQATSLYAGVTVPTPMSALKVGAAFDYLDVHNGGTAANPSDDSTWVGGLYAFSGYG